MMTLEFRTLQPEQFYRQHLAVGRRPDGRGLEEQRPVTVSSGHVSTADGSAVVKRGNTSIVCGVRAEITCPSPDQPQRGYVLPNFQFSNSSVQNQSLHEAQRITQFLLTVLDSSQCLDTRDLCIRQAPFYRTLI